MSATVRPVLTEFSLGSVGWNKLHELARQRCRNPRDQALLLIRFALYHAVAGDDVELTLAQLDSLFDSPLQVA